MGNNAVLKNCSASEEGVPGPENVLLELLKLLDDKEEHVLRSSISCAVAEGVMLEMTEYSELFRRSIGGRLQSRRGDEKPEIGNVGKEAGDVLPVEVADVEVVDETRDISTGAKASISSCFKKRRAT